ncbi:MAG: LON peptidase substrate-binding domain-containing protein [SAR324 cluster bacterium]|nr:LON peptidase substrate-binding domain-containing protein [SAR324 cluster bacterium]
MMPELPTTIALFPLPGAILLPGSILPLHIFEPRYRQMLEDCIEGRPYIGMIQPWDNETDLYDIGCLGKIEHHRQLPNGNFLIRLQGEMRFRVREEISTDTPYRKALVDYGEFLHDSNQTKDQFLEKEPLYDAFKNYLEQRDLKVDWEKIETIPLHLLVNILSMNLEFGYSEKQTLLESHDLSTRWRDLIALLQMAAFADQNDETSSGSIN